MGLVVVGFDDEFHVELFGRVIRYYGANATSGLTAAFAHDAGEKAR
jgi:hypothetical protein